MSERPAAVVVVGDLARSPRMLNHARELVGLRSLYLVGLRERPFDPPTGAWIAPLRAWRTIGSFGIAGAAIRMGLICAQLLAVLVRRAPAVVLVQNPPTFPTLLAAWTAARWLRARLVVDWHNYGHSMLAMRLGTRHAITRLGARHERWMARRAVSHFCVSQAMQADLAREFGIRAEVLYDRPVEFLAQSLDESRLIAVCPAGWTADEDMAMLLEALELLTTREIEIHLTGDGPFRLQAEPRIAALRAAGWNLHAGFLKESDYRALLCRCHFGISLHRSSSGLDLAMKVVDLFAAGTPVCAFDYGAAVREQVRDGETGFFFRTAAELAALLARIVRERHILAPMRERIRECWSDTWSEEWRRVAAPVFGGPS